jgi:hypothetical protein
MKDSYQIVRDDIIDSTGSTVGGKKTTPLYNAIGYALKVNGKEYTVINEGGKAVYYDTDGNEVNIDLNQQTEDEKKLSKERFAIIPADDTSYNMYIVDLWNTDSSG